MYLTHAVSPTLHRMTDSLTNIQPVTPEDAEVLAALFGPYDGPVHARGVIRAFEEQLAAMPQALDAMPLFHHFADGLYGRELHVPAGCMLTGAIHKREHFNLVLKGDISVLTEDGPMRVRAPAVLVSKPGIKRLGFAHEDTVWLTISACESKAPEAAWFELVTDNYEDVPGEPIEVVYDTPKLTGG